MESTSAPNRVLVVVAVVIAVLVALGAFVSLYSPARQAVTKVFGPVISTSQRVVALATVPGELRAAHLITADGHQRVSGMGLAPAEEAALPAEVEKIYAQPFNQETVKKNGRVSEDGERVAFQTVLDTNASSSPASWQVNVAGVKNGDQYALGKGVLPFFIDPMHVGWVAPEGIKVGSFPSPNATSSAVTMLLEHPFTDAHVALAPTRNLVAFVNEGKIEVRHIALEGTTLITTYGGEFTSFAVSDDALYVLLVTDRGTEVTRFRFAEGEGTERIFTFPASLGVTGLSF